MNLIAFSGKARSGKSAAVNYLWSTYGYTRIAFADPLKMAAQQMFGLSPEQTWDDDMKEIVIPHWGMTPRQIFQLYGTEAVKPVFGADVWVRRLAMTYEILKHTDHVAIPDLRFDEEADWVKSQGGVIVEIRRGPGLAGSAGDHASERGLSCLPDYTIDNSDTLETLHSSLDALIRSVGVRA